MATLPTESAAQTPAGSCGVSRNKNDITIIYYLL
jgi:hypothetical protein